MCISAAKRLVSSFFVAAVLCPAIYAADQPPKLRLAEVENIEPLSYKADLTLDPAKDGFDGSILIRMDVKQSTGTMWLNQERIKVKSATLTSKGKSFSARTVPGGDDFIGFQFDSPIPTGLAEFRIEYSGAVNSTSSAAIFREQDNGNWYIYSQFEPTDARGAFPCFDEPSYKTPWQITLHVPAADTAISNTTPASDKTTGANRTFVFHETEPLPSYLVAFAVGPFDYVAAGFTERNRVPVRIVVPKGHADEAKYAAEVTAGIINHHERYFGIPFPYDKADQVAIPATSGFGAMENPGMVTYAQTILLAKPENDTENRKRDYFTTAAHELAHQWFGDLVTTAWWNDIWLNEAFATWFEEKSTAEMHPEWQTDVEDVNTRLRVMQQDTLISARKIRQPIETKDDISNAFDDITYQKGAAVIGMFENWMTPAAFQVGVRSYLKQYAWHATTADDFLQALNASWKKDVATPFSTFLNQAGIPLISATLDCDGSAPVLHVEQERFLPVGSQGSTDRIWSVPLSVRYAGGRTEGMLLTSKSADWKLHTASCPSWIEANADAKGYYIVRYQTDSLAKLSSGDIKSRMNARERVDFIGDNQLLATGGKLPAGDALKLVTVFHDDPERDVELRAIALALWPREHFVPPDLEPNYQRFLRKNFQEQARALGWTPKPEEDPGTNLLRRELLPMMATYGGDKELADQATSLADQWLTDHHSIPPGIVQPVLATAAYYGDKKLLDRLLTELQSTRDKQVRQQLIRAMGNFRDPDLLRAGMEAVITGKMRFMEGERLLLSGQQHEATRKLPFEFLQANWDKITSMMPSGAGFDFGSVLPQVGQSYCDAESRDQLAAFFKPRVDKFVGGRRNLNQVLEEINLCMADVETNKASIAAFLAQY